MLGDSILEYLAHGTRLGTHDRHYASLHDHALGNTSSRLGKLFYDPAPLVLAAAGTATQHLLWQLENDDGAGEHGLDGLGQVAVCYHGTERGAGGARNLAPRRGASSHLLQYLPWYR